MRRPTIFFNNELRDAAAMDKTWTARFSHAGPAAWNALLEGMRAVSDSVIFRKRLKTYFLVLLLMFVDYCCLPLMTLVMQLHPYSPCNRRTINLYDDDDDDDEPGFI